MIVVDAQPKKNRSALAHHDAHWGEALLFTAMVAAIQLLVFRYRYGTDGQVDILCAVNRILDPAYLSRDFFTNAISGFGARYYYVRTLAFLTYVMPLPMIIFLLTWGTLWAMALATYGMAYHLFGQNRVASMLACALMLPVGGFSLGLYSLLQIRYLYTSAVAIPWTLLAIGMGLMGRPLTCCAIALAASFIHPMSLQAGLLGIAAPGIHALAGIRRHPFHWRWDTHGPVLRAALAGGILIAAGVFMWGLSGKPFLSTERLFEIYAQFRMPHHLLPSHFGLGPWLLFVCAMLGSALLWLRWHADMPSQRPYAWRMLILAALIFILCAGGYVFVELIPTRLFILGTVYRLLYIIKWFSMLLLAGAAARALERPWREGGPAVAGMLLIGTGAWQPIEMMAGCIAFAVHDRMEADAQRRWARLWWGAFAVMAAVALYGAHKEELGALTAYLMLAAWFARMPDVRARWMAPFAAFLLGVALLACARLYDIPYLSPLLERYQPILTMEEDRDEVVQLGELVRENTPEDALLVIPAELFRLRVAANRAVIADPYALPFREDLLEEWYRRVLDCYGEPEERPDHIVDETQTYARMPEARLRRLADTYGATHAVLYRNTQNHFPVLCSFGAYVLVKIEERGMGEASTPR